MKVLILSTGEIQTVNPCYGLRLMEQGIAKLAPVEAKQENPPKPEKKKTSRKESGEIKNGTG